MRDIAWCAVPPKSKTGQGLNYLLDQEPYMKVFLTDGDVPQHSKRSNCKCHGLQHIRNRKTESSSSVLLFSIYPDRVAKVL